MDLFTYLLGKKGQNTQKDLFSYLLGKSQAGTLTDFEGTNLTISNTVGSRLKNIQLKGQTSQNTTTGKNIFNMVDYTTIDTRANQSPSGTTKTVNSISFTSNAENNYSGIYITIANLENYIDNFSSDTTYYVSADITTNKACTMYYGTTSNSEELQIGTQRLVKSGTLSANFVFYVRATEANIKIENIMVSTSNDTTYEPYTGGQPSPSPSYPQPIKVVTGDNSVVIQNKNLFEIKTPDYIGQSAWESYGGNTYTKLENGYYFPGRYTAIGFQYDNLEAGQQYTISFDVVSNDTAGMQVGLNVYKNHTEQNYWKSYTATATIQRITWTFTADVTNRIAFNSGSTDDRNFTITNIQLEKGSTATEYVPYQQQTYPISLGDIELAEIEDYQDYIYGSPNNWYKYKVLRNVPKDVFSIITTYQNIVYITFAKPTDYLGRGSLSNYPVMFEKGTYQATTGGVWDTTDNLYKIFPNGSNTLFYFGMPLGTTIESAEAILNGTYMLYPIEPVSEQITDTTLIEQLNNLYNNARTYKDQTTIYTTYEDGNEQMIISLTALIKN